MEIVNIIAFAIMVYFISVRLHNMARIISNSEVNESPVVDIGLAMSAAIFYGSL